MTGIIRSRADSRILLDWDGINGWTPDGVMVTVDGIEGTYTRAGSKYVVDRAGVVCAIPKHAPPLHHEHVVGSSPSRWDPVGSLFERASSAVWTYTRDLTQAAYTMNNLTPALAATGSDGRAALASALRETATNTTHYFTRGTGTITAGAKQSVRIDIKPQGRPYVLVQIRRNAGGEGIFGEFQLTGNGGTAGYVAGTSTLGMVAVRRLANGYYACELAGIINGSDTSGTIEVNISGDGLTFNGYNGDVTKGIDVDFFQFERDSGAPSSRVWTTSATVTRAVDVPSLPFNLTSAQLAVTGCTLYDDIVTHRPGVINGGLIIGSTDVGGYNSIELFLNSSGVVGAMCDNASQTFCTIAQVPSFAQRVQRAVSVTPAGVVTLAISLDGGAIQTGTPSAASTWPTAFGAQRIYLTDQATAARAGDIARRRIRVLIGVHTLAECVAA